MSEKSLPYTIDREGRRVFDITGAKEYYGKRNREDRVI